MTNLKDKIIKVLIKRVNKLEAQLYKKRKFVELTEDEIIGHTCECLDDGTFNIDCAIDFANSMQETLKRYNT
jgi:hypothetical protein